MITPGATPTPVVAPTTAPAPAPIAPPVTARSPGEVPQAERPRAMASTAMTLCMDLLTRGSGAKFPQLLQRPVAAEHRVLLRQRRLGDVGHGFVMADLGRPVLIDAAVGRIGADHQKIAAAGNPPVAGAGPQDGG